MVLGSLRPETIAHLLKHMVSDNGRSPIQNRFRKDARFARVSMMTLLHTVISNNCNTQLRSKHQQCPFESVDIRVQSKGLQWMSLFEKLPWNTENMSQDLLSCRTLHGVSSKHYTLFCQV